MAMIDKFNVDQFNDFLIDYLEQHPDFVCDIEYSDGTISFRDRIPLSVLYFGIQRGRNPVTGEIFGPKFVIGNKNGAVLSLNCDDINSIEYEKLYVEDWEPEYVVLYLVNGEKIKLCFEQIC